MTLSERLDETNGRPSGFDYLRVALAGMIVVWHTVVASYGVEAQRVFVLGYSRPIWSLLLPMFFALSGFLISGSLERSRTLIGFVGLRIIRLAPALAVESLISMLIIGPLFTSRPLTDYFADPQFRSYLFNLVGDVHFYLPGVFGSNPTPHVNGQLWTLPFEMKCYIAISILAIFGAYKIWMLLALACFAIQAIITIHVYTSVTEDLGIVGGSTLIASFLFGVLLYRMRSSVPWSFQIFVATSLLSVALLCFHELGTLAPLPVAYSTVYLGLLSPNRSRIVSSGDYSYGIFLYGYPIQQSVAALPEFRFWWVNFAISAPIIAATAWASWHLIEKKAVALRGPFNHIEARLVSLKDWLLSSYGGFLPPGLRARWAPPS